MERSVAENFYVVGGTLARDAPCYVERAADKRLMAALQQGEICYVLTSRQMGKSSLMVRTAVRLREHDTAVAVLDLTSLGQNLTAEQWYNGLLDRTGQQLSLEDEVEDSWLQLEHLGPFQRWVQSMRQVVLPSRTGRIVIFIDEIDTVRSLPFPTDEFFAGIRELYNRRSEDSELKRLTFCLLGVATPADLIRDTRTTPFNVGRRIELTDFSGEEALPLALGMGRDQAVGLKFLRRILYWTGGHPYLTQRLCQSVAEHRTLDSTKSVDEICTDLFLSNRARERDDNLLFVRDRMLRSEVDTAGLLTLYSKVRAGKRVHDDEADPLVGVLRLSGITTVDHGYLKVRNRIYEHVFDHEWIVSNLPGSELRRQRTAYKKGFKRALLVAVPLMLLLAFGVYDLLFRANTLPPQFSKHLEVPAFWLSSSLRTAPTSVGSLRLKVGEGNVTVFVNNQQYGTTGTTGELLVPDLKVGAYDIRLEKPGFQTVFTPKVPVFSNNESPLEFKLQRLITSGELKITEAPPETTVRVDGFDAGVTDANGALSFSASPGDHNLELVKDGYISERLTQHVDLGKTGIVSGKLKPDLEGREWREVSAKKDPESIRAFLKKYPNGRLAAEARKDVESLDWNRVKTSNDPEALASFLQNYPQSQFSAEANDRMNQIRKEAEDYKIVSASNKVEDLQRFLGSYPNGLYAPKVRDRIDYLKDQKTILSVLQQYQQAYDRRDMDAILRLWPKCPEDKKRNLGSLFSNGQAGTIKLDVTTQPQITGEHALVVCDKTRVSPGATSKTTARIQLMREGGSWVIESGTL